MSQKNPKRCAYTVRVDDKSTYDQVKKYLTHFDSFNRFKSEKMVDPLTKKPYTHIYVDYIEPISLDPKKMYGSIFSKCDWIPYQPNKEVRPDQATRLNNIETKLDTINQRMDNLEAKLNTALVALQRILESI